MKKFDKIIEKYTEKGIAFDNIDYAISAIKDGTRREMILESLTADYRGMKLQEANIMLEELYKINGGEFKKENRGGYLYSAVFFIAGACFSFYIYYVYTYGGTLYSPIAMFIGAIGGILGGIMFLLLSLFGEYRQEIEPFQDN
jgi:hypothetical protein